jgi:hypothetical protein
MSDKVTTKMRPLNAAAAGAGDYVEGRTICRETIITFVAKTTGAPTSVVIDIEGDIDKLGAATLATHTFSAAELTAELAMFHISGKPVDRLRYNITTLSGGTSPTVNISMT